MNTITADVVTKNPTPAPYGTFTKLEELAHLKGSDLVSEVCTRCEGQQRIMAYLHVHDGICYKCHGKRVTVKKVSSVRARIKAAQKRIEDAKAREEARKERQRKYEEAKARRIEEQKANSTPVPTGKVEIVGEVVSIKLQEGYYGSTYKMLVNAGTWRVWGTIPKAIDEVEKGDIVKFSATVEASEKDESFGFYKRPTKAKIVAKGI